MLEIKKISKIYETDSFKQKALDNVSIVCNANSISLLSEKSGSSIFLFLLSR